MKNCCQLGEDRIHLIVLSVSHRGRRHQGRRHQGRIERRKRLDILHILPEVHSGLGLGRTEALCPPLSMLTSNSLRDPALGLATIRERDAHTLKI